MKKEKVGERLNPLITQHKWRVDYSTKEHKYIYIHIPDKSVGPLQVIALYKYHTTDNTTSN